MTTAELTHYHALIAELAEYRKLSGGVTPAAPVKRRTATAKISPARARYLAACEAQGIPVVEISTKVRNALKKWENKYPGIRCAA